MKDYLHLTRLRDEWQALQPLQPKDEARLWRKLKLEWNYHSNHIEGNMLSYGETELLLIHGQASGDHALRDYVEMQAHDVAITHLRTLVADDRRALSQTDIRDLNRILLKEPFWKEAITKEGHLTRIEILPGEYKTQPNNVRTASGEIFRFADPLEVPARMAAMLANLHETRDEDSAHPIEIAAWLHHEFVLIHPFGDGNGRTARLLVNYLLMRTGYLPLIVPTERKDTYLAALRRADAGDRLPLTAFLAGCAEISMRRGIRAAKGESIEDEGDLEKEIELFKRRKSPGPRDVLVRSPEVVARLSQESLRPLCFEFIRTLSKLDDLFARSEVKLNGNEVVVADLATPEDLGGSVVNSLHGATVRYVWGGFLEDREEPFGLTADLSVRMKDFGYSITAPGTHLADQPYGRPIPESDRRDICRKALAKVFNDLKTKAGREDRADGAGKEIH